MMRSRFCLEKRRNIPSLFFSLLWNGWTIFALRIFAYGGIWSAGVWVDRSTNSAASIAQPLLWTSSLVWDTFEIKLILRFLSIIHSDSFVAQSLLVSCVQSWHNPFFQAASLWRQSCRRACRSTAQPTRPRPPQPSSSPLRIPYRQRPLAPEQGYSRLGYSRPGYSRLSRRSLSHGSVSYWRLNYWRLTALHHGSYELNQTNRYLFCCRDPNHLLVDHEIK